MAAAAQEISIRLEGDAFRVAGWKPSPAEPQQGWSSVFRFTAAQLADNVPPLAAPTPSKAAHSFFIRAFALVPGVRYRAVFQPPGGKPIEASFEKKREQLAATTRVTHVYPSTDVLPSNTLKLYIYFSAPMSRGEAWQHIHCSMKKASR